MLRHYSPLPFDTLPQGVHYAQPTQRAMPQVALDSPALDVMTNLTQVAAVTVLAGDTVDEALRRMLQFRVRLLLVVNQERGMMGVITADDIAGEGPVQMAVQQGIDRHEVLVRDVMTPCRNLQVLHFEQVRSARVGHVVATLKEAGRRHTLVIDHDTTGNTRLRGIFSATQIFRQLDLPFQPNVLAGTFAEIEARLMH